MNKIKAAFQGITLWPLAWLLLGLCAILPGSVETNSGLQIPIRVGQVVVRVEVAATPERRRKGLMQRRHLMPDEGLLLVFPQPKIIVLWMLNTPLPLDVGFFDQEGVLISFLTMQPDGGKTIHRSPGPALYALEMNQGWFESNGVRGMQLRLPYSLVGR